MACIVEDWHTSEAEKTKGKLPMASKQTARAVLTILWLLLLTTDAVAISDNEWKQYSELQRDTYIFGVVDTWQNFAQMEKYVKQSFPNVKQPSQVTSGIPFTTVANCIMHLSQNNFSNL